MKTTQKPNSNQLPQKTTKGSTIENLFPPDIKKPLQTGKPTAITPDFQKHLKVMQNIVDNSSSNLMRGGNPSKFQKLLKKNFQKILKTKT